MIPRIVDWALRARDLVMMLALALLVAGIFAYKRLPVEAYPNPLPPLVEVIAQPPGMSAEETELYVTVPLERALAGMPGLEDMRSQSLFGLTDVKCYFSRDTTYAAARQEVLNRINAAELPDGVKASLSPWNAIGEIYRFQIRGKGYSPLDLKTAEDWVVEKHLKQVPGVIDVVSFGGETKQFHVGIDPFRLRGKNVGLDEVLSAIGNANTNVGGERLVIGEQSYTVRGIGLIRDVHDIEDVVVAEHGGTPVRVRDIGDVNVGAAPRLGVVGKDEQPDIVQGVVLMRYGEETTRTLEGVRERVERMRREEVLPPGMEIVPYYDRGELVSSTTHTVIENLVIGVLLVSVILVLFLGHVRAALITAINIPLALLAAFCGMVATGTPANLISLGAIDFGIVVHSAVIMTENMLHHVGAKEHGNVMARIRDASREVGGPIAFSTLIIAAAFIPLFTMSGVAGVIFAPMAITYAFAIAGAIVLAFTLTPALATRALRIDDEDRESFLMRKLSALFKPIVRWSATQPKLALAIGGAVVVLGLASSLVLGGELMPKLEEGNFWIRATLPSSVSLEQASTYANRARAIVHAHPEVTTVVTQLGRPDDGTDVAGLHNLEIFAPLRPSRDWKRGVTKESLTAELQKELGEALPGVELNFAQMISDNVEEAVSGVKGENSVKVFGSDVRSNEKIADEIHGVLAKVPGIEDLAVLRSSGQPSVKIVPDRKACARYGLNTGDVERVVQAAIGGRAITQVFQGEKRFDLTVRWLPPYRASIEAIREITVSAPAGMVIPLGQLAKVSTEDSPGVVYRENAQRFTPLKFSVRGRDLASTIKDAEARITAAIKLPYETRLAWSGEMNELEGVFKRLAVVVPISLFVIMLLVKGAVKSAKYTAIVLANVPIAASGGVLALLVTGIHFSVSAAMGFIAIFGVAIQDAILVVSQLQGLEAEGNMSMRDAVIAASERRLRPVLMTAAVVLFGLLPAAVSTGIGSQTQKPLAVVVMGGALMLALGARVLQPALLVIASKPRRPGTSVPD